MHELLTVLTGEVVVETDSPVSQSVRRRMVGITLSGSAREAIREWLALLQKDTYNSKRELEKG